MSFDLVSDYSTKISAISTNIDYGKKPVNPGDDDDDNTGSSTGWIIAVSIIGSLLLIGGVGFFIWKKK